MGRNSRARRRVGAANVGTSIEFAELLDPVSGPPASPVLVSVPVSVPVPVSAPVAAAIDTEPDVDPVEVADLVPEPEPEPEPEPALVAVSRFADSGIDDDRLPLHDTKKRSRRH